MQFFLISDNIDTLTGMRLSGIEGVVVHTKEEVQQALANAKANKDIAIVLITHNLVELCKSEVLTFKLTQRSPLIVEVPDRHNTSNISDAIVGYIREAVGIKL